MVFKLPWVPHFLSRQTWALITGSPGSTLPVLRIYSLPSMPVFGYFKRGFYSASMEQTLYGQVLVNKYYSLNRNQSFQTINIKMWAIESLWKCLFIDTQQQILMFLNAMKQKSSHWTKNPDNPFTRIPEPCILFCTSVLPSELILLTLN